MISAFAPLCPGFSPLLRQFVRTRCSSLGIASVRPPAPSGRREGKCTAFPNSHGCSSPVRILSGTCRSSHRTPIFRLGQGSAKFAAVPEQFKNSSFACGHSSPLSPDSLFSLPRWRAARRIGYEGQKKARAVRCCLPVLLLSSSLLALPPSGREERSGVRQAATEGHGSRAYLAYSPESFRHPYFVNEPQTRGAAARPNTGRGRCSLSENLFRYMKKNKQQKFAVFCTLSGGQA